MIQMSYQETVISEKLKSNLWNPGSSWVVAHAFKSPTDFNYWFPKELQWEVLYKVIIMS